MRCLLLLSIVFGLASCISFPRAEVMKRNRKTLSTDAPARQMNDAPPIKTRKKFVDPYFR